MSNTHPQNRKLRVAVLMGGTSNERAVSLSTGNMILQALNPEKYKVIAIDTKEILALSAPSPLLSLPTPQETSETGEATSTLQAGTSLSPLSTVTEGVAVQTDRPDVVFIALHGKGGEDGTIQGMLELMGLPYTGSGVLASALAMDKTMSKRLFRSAGIPVIPEVVIRRSHALSDAEIIAKVCAELGELPVFVKPNAEGSTVGCALVTGPEQLPAAVANALKYDPVALVETYVQGMEITVGVLGNADAELQALPVIEIVPKSAFYDYESKYADGGSEHIIPARLPEATLQRAQEIALQCHTLLGCRGMSRTDMIVTQDQLYVLETNTIPGMTPTSLLPQAAEHAGISFADLLDRILELGVAHAL